MLPPSAPAAPSFPESPQLLLVPCTVAHFEAALRHHSALAELMDVTVGADWAGSPEATGALAPARDFLLQNPAAQRWWMYLFVHKATRQLIGTGGFKGAPDADGMVEIGYSLAPAWRGQGLATEAAQALVTFAFRHPEVRRVDAHTLPERNASARILEKLGMVCTGSVIDPEDGEVWHWQLRRPEPGSRAGAGTWAAVALGLALLTSCGEQAATTAEKTAEATETALPGKALFLQNCAICHGPNGRLGVNGAHDLTKSNLNQMGRVYMVTNGLGQMPGFKDQLTPAQIEQVAAYTLTLQ